MIDMIGDSAPSCEDCKYLCRYATKAEGEPIEEKEKLEGGGTGT